MQERSRYMLNDGRLTWPAKRGHSPSTLGSSSSGTMNTASVYKYTDHNILLLSVSATSHFTSTRTPVHSHDHSLTPHTFPWGFCDSSAAAAASSWRSAHSVSFRLSTFSVSSPCTHDSHSIVRVEGTMAPRTERVGARTTGDGFNSLPLV